MNDYSIHCPIFAAYCLKRNQVISNIAHVLSKVSNVIDRRQRQRRKETKNTIKIGLCFTLGGMQQFNS